MVDIVQQDGPPRHPSVRYEPKDANFRWIIGLILAAITFGVFLQFTVWDFFRGERDRLADTRRSKYPLAPRPSTALPPEPRLEQLDRLRGDEVVNVYVRQELKLDRLSRYGQADEKWYVHIPIDRAMEVLGTGKQLPARSEQAGGKPRDLGLVDGGEPNSGRMFNRRKPRWSVP